MQASSGVLLLLVIPCVFSSQLDISNYCGSDVDVWYTANGQNPQSLGWLPNTKTWSVSGIPATGFNIKSGQFGKTLAELNFGSPDSNDYYDLSIIDGFDVGMGITSSNGGGNPMCTHDGCDEAMQFPDDWAKIHGCSKGGTFDVIFCPSGVQGESVNKNVSDLVIDSGTNTIPLWTVHILPRTSTGNPKFNVKNY
ncbi:hypothetical protein M3Y99_00112200 [Aphelenchoides fujianensis]|nr:hypothetical protein M3Y99_00112200 [Aphelenchoides fujianensis]